jgi:rhomboid family GlyGly-CTERM serine protease
MKLSRAAKIKANLVQPAGIWMLAVMAMVALTLLCQTIAPNAVDALRWQSDALSGQYWRLWTGHFVHLGFIHGLLNLLACLLIWLIFVADWRRIDGFLMFASLPLTGILLAGSELDWYVGLSGVLHGWFLLGAVRVWPQQKVFAGLLLLGLAAKLYWEPQNPAAAIEMQWIGGPIAYVSHQVGALAMLVLLLLQFAGAQLWDRVRR